MRMLALAAFLSYLSLGVAAELLLRRHAPSTSFPTSPPTLAASAR